MRDPNTLIETKLSELGLDQSEKVLACCMLAREQVEVGDYDAGCAALRPWWSMGAWPIQKDLTERAAAELLLTAGILSGFVASTKRITGGQKPAEALLSGSI